ncbi:MAG TPA: hypothetical protein VLA19_26725 [Herpetosiphonaceae bacterium]|nr:hypothetical protein [Herpetosiphonaceae bacterium]
MRRLLLGLLLTTFATAPTLAEAGSRSRRAYSYSGDVYVQPHVRGDGGYVQPHYRSAPNAFPQELLCEGGMGRI